MSKPETRKIKAKMLLSRARDAWIPALPRNVRTVLALCGDRYVSADKISRVVLEDYGLTFRLFRLMNSAFFSIQRKDLVSIRYMVVLLGLENLVRAVSRSKVATLSGNPNPSRDIEHFFMAQGLVAGKLAGMLALNLGLDPEKAMLVAMFRNLGQVISAVAAPEIAVSCLEKNRLVMDEARFKKACGGYTTEGLGFELSRTWNLPMLLRVAICPSRFNLKSREADERNLLILARLLRELLEAALLKGRPSRHIHVAKKALEDAFNVKDKALRRILFDLKGDFIARHQFYFRILESQGLFARLLNG